MKWARSRISHRFVAASASERTERLTLAGRPSARWRSRLLGTLLAFAAPLLAQSPKITARAPVKDFTLPFFNDAGHRTMLVRGGEALLANPERVTIHDLTLTVFDGGPDNKVDTVILSPGATVLPEEKAVTGEQVVRLVRDDLEVSGEAWRYDHDAKKILINRNVHIVFRTELKDILK